MPTWGVGRRALDVARRIQEAAPEREPVPPPPALSPKTAELPAVPNLVRRFDLLVKDPELSDIARSPFEDGYYAYAVEEAAKYINNLVKERSGEKDHDGSKLMAHVFSLANPVLRVNDLKTQSQKNQQTGYMQLLQGLMTGIRNPRAHEHSYLDEPDVALEILGLCNHLARIIKATKRTRARKKKS